MHVKFGHQSVEHLLFNWEVVLDVIMQYFETFEDFGMKTLFLKNGLSNLVIFDHAQYADFMDALY